VTSFIPGLKLSALFYKEAVKPILEAEFPDLVYSAALIGSGSEILGYDTAQSTDHHWGPRLMLFLAESDCETFHDTISETFSHKLPYTFHGYSTHFGMPDEIGVQLMKQIDSGPIAHRVEIYALPSFFEDYLGFDPYKEIGVLDWLTCSEQRLLTVTAGQIYHDGLGELHPIRARLAYYPYEVWLYVLETQWELISEEEAFMARCGDVGDELGSRIVAARLVRDLMKLCFIVEKQYAPYSKWFGTAFSRLKAAPILTPVFHNVLSAQTWQEREKYLSAAYEIMAEMHNALNITVPAPTKVSRFHERPYMVIHSEEIAALIRAAITDEQIRNIVVKIGALDQYIDCTDIAANADLSRKLRVLYEP
jgi:hypothetical protein